ncbi:MAG: hypothetical protein Q9195_002832 [Heterodermia aff. obscurata]
MGIGEIIRAGQPYPPLPPIDKDDTYKLSEIRKAHPNAQIQDFPADFPADVFAMDVDLYTGENGKPAVGNVNLTYSSQWLKLVDCRKTGTDRVLRIYMAFSTGMGLSPKPGKPIGQEWFYTAS